MPASHNSGVNQVTGLYDGTALAGVEEAARGRWPNLVEVDDFEGTEVVSFCLAVVRWCVRPETGMVSWLGC